MLHYIFAECMRQPMPHICLPDEQSSPELPSSAPVQERLPVLFSWSYDNCGEGIFSLSAQQRYNTKISIIP